MEKSTGHVGKRHQQAQPQKRSYAEGQRAAATSDKKMTTVKNTAFISDIKSKGHELTIVFDIDQELFACELPDGEVLSAPSFSELRKVIPSRLEAVKEQRPSVPCLYSKDGKTMRLAVYVGRHKNNRWTPFMFDVMDKGKPKRQNLSEYDVKNCVYKSSLDLARLQALNEAKKLAEGDLNRFLDSNRLDPTKECA